MNVDPRVLSRKYWPLAVAGTSAIGWYAADSLRHRREGAFGYEIGTDLEVGSRDFLRAAEALTGAPISNGNRADLLINGDAIFPAFLETIAAAERTLNLQTYVYWRGEIAADVAGAISDKAREGVRCNVILDALGSAQMERSQIREMRDAGAEVLLFRPLKPYAIKRVANRTHRRVLVADGEVGMTGGVGIAAEWMGNADDPDHWRDTHLRVRGPVVRGLQGAFAENWLEGTGEVLAGDEYLPELEPLDDGMPMQVVRSSAKVGDTNAEALYYLAIASARHSIDLTAAYFVPRPAFTEALCTAAKRGVDVRILVPGPEIDKGFVRAAGRAAYSQLLDAGVRLFEYQSTMLHAKTLCVDGSWSSVGTINFDNRSFQLHDEITLCVWDDRFAAELGQEFERDLRSSDEIEAERWSRRPRRHRAAEAATAVLRREL
ncbi:MAG TPA: cardiolipin synthase [Solirubrobacterales bacterium]|jgi:cardiolipin synthase